MPETIKIGTRGSKLALWQANHVAEKLRERGFLTEIVIIHTRGDQILDRSLAKIGSKGVFTEELETALRSGEIHLAQHSAKDVQSILPDDLELIAFMEREKSNDVVVSLSPNFTLETSGMRIGTSSVRRTAFLKRNYPHLTIVDMRGNLQTRLEKLKNGHADAMVLAYAGVYRMGFHGLIVREFSEMELVPPVGQGSVAIEVSKRLEVNLKRQIKETLNHIETETCLLAERAFLKTLEGGCSIPAFCYANLHENQLVLNGGLISVDGSKEVRFQEKGAKYLAVQLGEELAQKVLSNGGRDILAAIRSAD